MFPGYGWKALGPGIRRPNTPNLISFRDQVMSTSFALARELRIDLTGRRGSRITKRSGYWTSVLIWMQTVRRIPKSLQRAYTSFTKKNYGYEASSWSGNQQSSSRVINEERFVEGVMERIST